MHSLCFSTDVNFMLNLNTVAVFMPGRMTEWYQRHCQIQGKRHRLWRSHLWVEDLTFTFNLKNCFLIMKTEYDPWFFFKLNNLTTTKKHIRRHILGRALLIAWFGQPAYVEKENWELHLNIYWIWGNDVYIMLWRY